MKTSRSAVHGMLIAVATMAVAATATSAYAGKLEEVLERGHLVVGTGSTFAPWSFKDEAGNLVGFDIDIAKILAKGLFNDPEKIEFVIQGADARIPNVTTGKVDITCQYVTVTASRAQQVAFSTPYYREGQGLLVLASSPYQTYDSLKQAGDKVTAGALQNVFADDSVHQALPEAKVDQFDSPDLPFQALATGRIDVVASDASAIGWYLARFPGQYRDVGYSWYPQNYSCAVLKGDPEWLKWVDTALDQAMSGVDFTTYQASYEKWFGHHLEAPHVGFPQ